MSLRSFAPAALGLILAYVAFQHGGVLAEHWNYSLLALGLLSAAYWLVEPDRVADTRLDAWLLVPLLIIFAVALIQLLPLSSELLAMLSPQRAGLAGRFASVGLDPGRVVISVLPSASVPYVFRCLAYAAVFFLVRDWGRRHPRRRWQLVIPLLVVASLEALLGLLQYGLGDSQASARGTFVNRNHFAGMLELVLPFAVMYAVAAVARTKSGRGNSFAPFVLAGFISFVAVLLLVAILFSLSRMGFFSAISALAVLLGLGLYRKLAGGASRPARRLGIAAAAGALLTIGAFLFLTPQALLLRFADLASTEQLSAPARLRLWGETLDLIAAYPLTGVGPGGYSSAFLAHKVSVPLVRDFYVHNDYLQLLAETGWLSFLAAMFVAGLLVFRVFKTRLLTVSSERAALSAAVLAALAALAIHSIADFNLYIPANAFVAAWILGIGDAIADSTSDGPPPRPVRRSIIEVAR